MWKSAEDKVRRAEIFKDTQEYYKENRILKESIKESKKNTKFYASEEYPLSKIDLGKSCEITISGERTFESAIRLLKENPGKKVCVLNFASAIKPGGGVVHGAGAQEECLCRCSTLYPLLNTAENKKAYYEPNKKLGDNLHTDDIIYTPDVVICKTDTAFPERISEEEFAKVDVITCAAPNLNARDSKRYSGDNGFTGELSQEDLYKLHYKRCKHILNVAAANGMDILLLGAFGCGAFKNDPATVAKAMHDACKEYAKAFDIINFAVVKKGGRTNENYRVFEIELERR